MFTSCVAYTSIKEEPLINKNLYINKNPQKWWKNFENRELNELMEYALVQNLDLLAAKSRIKQASYSLSIAESLKHPDLKLSFNASKTTNYFDGSKEESNNLSGTLEASYEVDLWNRISSLNKASIHEYKYKKFDYQTSYVILSSNIVNNWYNLAYVHESKKLLKKRIILNHKELKLLKRRYQIQKVKLTDLLSQESTIKQLELELSNLNFYEQIYKNTIFSLLSKQPENVNFISELKIPKKVPKYIDSVPSSIILQRPDILTEIENLKAQDSKAAAAVSAQYPLFSLSASIRQNDMTLNNLFDIWYTTLIGSVVTPLFNTKNLKEEAKSSLEKRKELLLHLKQLFINASIEVSNALKEIQVQKKNYLLIKQQLIIDKKKEASYRINYLHGTGDFKHYLDSKTSLYLSQEKELTTRLDLIKAYVTFYRVTASAWSNINLREKE